MDKPLPERTHVEGPVRRPLLRGVHHLALNTDNLCATLDFWVRILGMPLVHGLTTGAGGAARAVTRGNPPYEAIPHFFVDMGGDSTVAFFEYPRDQNIPKADRNHLATMQHVSFAASPGRFVEMQARLKRNGVEITFGPKVVMPPNIQSMYFYDPNGIRLEITADMDGDEDDLKLIRSVTQDRATLQSELEKISADASWIEGMLECMPEAPPLYPPKG